MIDFENKLMEILDNEIKTLDTHLMNGFYKGIDHSIKVIIKTADKLFEISPYKHEATSFLKQATKLKKNKHTNIWNEFNNLKNKYLNSDKK